MTEYIFNFTYPNNCDPMTVGDLMRKLYLPRKWRHFLRSENRILVNGKYLPLNFLVYPEDQIKISLDHVESNQHPYQPSGNLPQVIYEDQNILVINKPSGQKTHPNLNEHNTALNDIATYLGSSPFIVHRLDMLTNGLLLVAKNPAVVPLLNRQLTNKTLHREYIATVTNPDNLANHGTLTFPIGHDPDDQRKRKVTKDGLKSITHYQVLERFKDSAKVKVSLETGRTHQIRVHLAHIGSPIIGDPLYNPTFSGEKLQLTAYQLTFIKPFSFSKQTVQLDNFKL